MPKDETGITDTGEQPDPVNRKVRRTTSSWASDSRAAYGDGQFTSDGVREVQRTVQPRVAAKRRMSR